MIVVPLPGMLERRLADFGGNRAKLAAALVAEGWHPKNVERVLGNILADWGSNLPPKGPNASGSHGAATPPAQAPAPRRDGSSTTLPVAAPPRAKKRRAPVLGPVRTPETERATYGERVDIAAFFDEVDVAPIAEAPRAPSNVLHLPLAERPRMFPGPGARHECVHEAGCLGRALSAEPRARFVHCPTFCKHLQAPSFEARLANNGGRGEGNL